MLVSLLRGLVLGFVICIPVGPVNVAVIDTAIRKTYRQALAVALGGAAIDFLYSQLAVTGIGLFLRESPRLTLAFEAVGGVVLLVYGLITLRAQPLDPPHIGKATPREREMFGSFMTGVLLMVLNPATLISWVLLAGLFMMDLSRVNALWMGVGVFFGTWGWFWLIAWLATKGRVKLGRKAVWITRVVAVLLLGYGVFLLGKVAVTGAWRGILG